MSAPARLQILGISGIGEVQEGGDLASLLVEALAAQRTLLVDGDVVAVSSKVVSKAAGLVAALADREAVVLAQSVRTLAARRTPAGIARIVEAVAGPVMAAAGVDASNVADGTILVLPADPDAAARALRERLHEITGATVGVVVTDTAGRAWREGQIDFALGVAGITPLDDLRGTLDAVGRELSVTARALVDEIASAADLVKGKTDGIPAALVRGLADLVTPLPEHGDGARSLVRAAAGDWFRLGHIEAVRAAIGAAHVDPPPVVAGSIRDRLDRVAEVAAAGGSGTCRVENTDLAVALRLRADDEFTLGALAQRVLAALWTEGFTGTVVRDGTATVVRVSEN
ncbi:MAG: coenzyme F420-0:L-glutamate ligase [Janthinobacterium lividum]